jgi:hypothetical protein
MMSSTSAGSDHGIGVVTSWSITSQRSIAAAAHSVAAVTPAPKRRALQRCEHSPDARYADELGLRGRRALELRGHRGHGPVVARRGGEVDLPGRGWRAARATTAARCRPSRRRRRRCPLPIARR